MKHAIQPNRRQLARLGLAALCGGTLLQLAGCAAPQLSDYAQSRPAFDLQQYFNGRLSAHGQVSDRSGRVTRRFVVTLQCDWVNDQGTLDEQFVYDDGERQQRVWHVRKLADGRYSGQAADVVGEALGASSGAAFQWRYTLKLPYRGSVYEVQFDDWMQQIDAHTVLNKAEISKFGLRVGEVLLSFHRP